MERFSRLEWIEGFHFDAYSHSGKRVRMDGWKDREREETGPTPAEMVPMALGACTGMDVILILEKMRLEPGAFELEVNAVLSDEHPRMYTDFQIIYHFHGEDLDSEKVERAITLSRDKYCSISYTLEKVSNITHFYSINNGELREVPRREGES